MVVIEAPMFLKYDLRFVLLYCTNLFSQSVVSLATVMTVFLILRYISFKE